MAEFEINSRLYTIVTDTAANVVKAFSLSGMKSLRKITTDDDVDVGDDVIDDGDDDEDYLQEVTITDESDFLPPHRSRCFAHTLQLVVNDGLEQAGKINNVNRKVGNLVSHVRRSTSATDRFDGCTKLESTEDVSALW